MDKPYEFTQKVAAKLKYLRKAHGYTQEEMAKKLYIGQTTYSKYERGCLVMNGTLAKQIANIFNVSVSYILDDAQEDILITKEQYKKLLEIKETIIEIEKAYEKAQNPNIDKNDFQTSDRLWKYNKN